MWRLYTDLFDSGDQYRILVEIPRTPKEDLEITMSDSMLSIEAGGRTYTHGEKAPFVLSAGADTKTLRRVTLPEEVWAEKAEACLNNGVLEVRVPKKTPTGASKQ